MNANERTSLLQDSLRTARDTEILSSDTLDSVREQRSTIDQVINLVLGIHETSNQATVDIEELAETKRENTRKLWITFIALSTINTLIIGRIIWNGRIL